MKSKKDHIKFVRIRGRIVPIRINKNKAKSGLREIKRGAIVTTSSSIIGGLFSEKARSLGRAVSNAEDVQTKLHNMGRGSSKKTTRIINKLLKKQSSFVSASKISFGIATFVGGAFLAKGLSDLGKSQDLIDVPKDYEETVSTFSSGVVGFGLSVLGGPKAAKFAVRRLRKTFKFAGNKNPFRSSGLSGINRFDN